MEYNKIDIIQDNEWDDISGKGSYEFGKEGYLVMDGSTGPIQCRRDLLKPIAGPSGAVELKMRMVLGRAYVINFLDKKQEIILSCKINKDGRILIIDFTQKKDIDTGTFLTYHNGVPYPNISRRKPYTVLSDEHIFRFEQWDFQKKECYLSLDSCVPVRLPQFLKKDTDFLKSIELQTLSNVDRPCIYLKSYHEYFKGQCIENDRFPLSWQPLPAPEGDTPYDNITGTKLRPKGNHWMEVSTGYGYVKARISSLWKGSVEFDLMTGDIEKESCFLLEEASGVIKDAVLMCGIYQKHFIFTNEMPPTFTKILYSENFEEPVPDKIYNFKVVWDCGISSCWIYINGVLQRFGGKTRMKLMTPPEKGVDTLTIHPGLYGVRLSKIENEKGSQPIKSLEHKSCWGAFRIRGELRT